MIRFEDTKQLDNTLIDLTPCDRCICKRVCGYKTRRLKTINDLAKFNSKYGPDKITLRCIFFQSASPNTR